jgi:O-antigen/teichoic acid export membrane protein
MTNDNDSTRELLPRMSDAGPVAVAAAKRRAVLSLSLKMPALDPIARDWAVVIGGSGTRLGLGLVSSVLLARTLGTADFGLLVSLGALAAIVGTAADLGLTEAGVRAIAKAWSNGEAELGRRATSLFWLRIVVSGGFALLACAAAFPLAARAFGRPVDQLLVVLAFVGVFATALSGTGSALLQAAGRFRSLSAVTLTNAGLTTILAVGLSLVGQLTLVSALVVLGIGTSLASFAVSLCALPPPLRPGRPRLKDLAREGVPLLRVGLWLWAARLLATTAAYLDLFIVNQWVSPAGVGAYALALNLSAKVDVVNQSLHTVLLPAASALQGGTAVTAYLRGSVLRNAVVAFALLALLPLAGPLITALYGREYEPSVALFDVLVIVVLVDLFAMPIALLALGRGRVRLVAGSDALRILVLGIAALELVPAAGAMGAAVARLIARAAGGVTVVAGIVRAREAA